MNRALISLLITACGANRLIMREPPSEPFDAVVVPGCPVRQDGAPSRCLLGRAAWAALVYQRGWATRFITSGGAVHSPYVEAEMLARIMETLGVPADRIIVEPNALHTDENVYNALMIARALDLKRLAVASDSTQAAYAARMLVDWAPDARALAMETEALDAFIGDAAPRLQALRVRRVAEFVDIAEQERAREKRTGRSRPPSYLLYPMLGYFKWIGRPWTPITPAEQSMQTWDRLRESAP